MRGLKLMAGLAFALLAFPAMSQSPAPQSQQMPPFDILEVHKTGAYFLGGMLGVVGVECGAYTQQQVDEAKRLQSQAAARDGLPLAQFEVLYANGYSDARGMWDIGTPSDKAEACGEFDRLIGSP